MFTAACALYHIVLVGIFASLFFLLNPPCGRKNNELFYHCCGTWNKLILMLKDIGLDALQQDFSWSEVCSESDVGRTAVSLQWSSCEIKPQQQFTRMSAILQYEVQKAHLNPSIKCWFKDRPISGCYWSVISFTLQVDCLYSWEPCEVTCRNTWIPLEIFYNKMNLPSYQIMGGKISLVHLFKLRNIPYTHYLFYSTNCGNVARCSNKTHDSSFPFLMIYFTIIHMKLVLI